MRVWRMLFEALAQREAHRQQIVRLPFVLFAVGAAHRHAIRQAFIVVVVTDLELFIGARFIPVIL